MEPQMTTKAEQPLPMTAEWKAEQAALNDPVDWRSLQFAIEPRVGHPIIVHTKKNDGKMKSQTMVNR